MSQTLSSSQLGTLELDTPNHPSLKVVWSVPVQHVLYAVLLFSQATQYRVDPARFLQQM